MLNKKFRANQSFVLSVSDSTSEIILAPEPEKTSLCSRSKDQAFTGNVLSSESELATASLGKEIRKTLPDIEMFLSEN